MGKGFKYTFLQIKIHKWPISTYKDAQNNQSLGDENQNQNVKPPTLLAIKMIITSIGEEVQKLDPSCIAGRNMEWCSCFGTVLNN